MKYFFHPGARLEHLELIDFYASRRAGLGLRYFEAFDVVIERICRAPRQFPLELAPDIRRCRIAGFPCNALFREAGDAIEVLAVAGHRRRSHYWIARV